MSTTPLGGATETVAEQVASGAGTQVKGRSPRQLAVARFKKDKGSMFALVVVSLFALMAITAPLMVKLDIIDPYTTYKSLLNPDLGSIPSGKWGGISSAHPLGVVPQSGWDVMSRLILGVTFSMAISLAAAILTMLLGTVLGIVAGTSRGFADWLIGRIIDLTLSFPQTLMLLALSGTAVLFLVNLGVPKGNPAKALYIILVLALFGWPTFARIVRGQVLSLREREFVDAARVMGASKRHIYFKEMLPNLVAPILVYFTLVLPTYVSAEAALSFLGVGLETNTPTLGNILADGIQFSTSDPTYFVIPAVVIAAVVVSFNLLGDGLRDALDPKSDR